MEKSGFSNEFKLIRKEDLKNLKDAFTNINVGIMGHIDSGKTTICSSLTSIASTAALDKNPQSKERGITMDLGFSSFAVELSSLPQNSNTGIM
jgi:selenocysteine-specific elongation factor